MRSVRVAAVRRELRNPSPAAPTTTPKSGHQLVTQVGRLNFLCSDQLADALIVIELKRERPSDKVVGKVAHTSAMYAPSWLSRASSWRDSSLLITPMNSCGMPWRLSHASSS